MVDNGKIFNHQNNTDFYSHKQKETTRTIGRLLKNRFTIDSIENNAG